MFVRQSTKYTWGEQFNSFGKQHTDQKRATKMGEWGCQTVAKGLNKYATARQRWQEIERERAREEERKRER